MAKEALASEDLAKKFATEKETPYTRWVKAKVSTSSRRSTCATCAPSR